MGLLIDTSVLIAAGRGQLHLPPLLAEHGENTVALAAISASELLHGVHRLAGIRRAKSEAFVERIIKVLPVVAFDLAIARVHATLSADLRARGIQVGAHDLMIAATAVHRDDAVATRDLRSFPRIRGLEIIRW